MLTIRKQFIEMVEEMGSISTDSRRRTNSNLRCFLDSVTPVVDTHTILKRSSYTEMTTNRIKCFYLADLWNQFYEWSACGVGAPVNLPSSETVVQYFVPYLSAIQLYTNTPYYLYSECNGYDNMCDEYNWYNVTDNWSEQNEYQMAQMAWNTVDEKSSVNNNAQLCFQYFELDSPYERIPLADKVYELSHNFPALASLKSADLSPYSWMSIFWHPIYHVPMKNQKDLSTCFLTYHNLSTPEDNMPPNSEDALHHCVMLAPFGLATRKLEGMIWANTESGDQEQVASLFHAAQSWLNQLGLQHHDFNYFRIHSA